MFRENEGYKQQRMFTAVYQLPETARKHLEQSWAQVFYHEFFYRINEAVFSVLYSDKHSRPNTPIKLFSGESYEHNFEYHFLTCRPHRKSAHSGSS